MQYYLLMFVLLLSQISFVTSQKQKCGIALNSGMNKVVGGVTVSGKMYPWFVALITGSSKDYTVACGASLISPKFILTAAHCYAEYPKSKWLKLYKLVYNLEDRCNPNDKVLTRPQPSKVEIHNRYKNAGLSYDIALITLPTKVTLMPICLPSPSMKVTQGEVIGFGSDLPRAASRYPCELQEAKLPILTKRQCLRTSVASTVKSLSGIICAGRTQGGIDSCDGDSGGPLQVIDSGRYVLLGIVSFGLGCARKDMPGVYTDVRSYLDWIRTRIQDRNIKPSNKPIFSFPSLFNFSSQFPWLKNYLPHQ